MTYRLPLRLPVSDGESVLSMLNRTAHLLDRTLDDIIRITGASTARDKPKRLAHLERSALTESERLGIASALAISPEQVAAGTVERFHNRGLVLAKRGSRVTHFTLWSEPDRGAVCPDCLRQRTGRQIEWRLAWTFLCHRHGRLLIDTCPYCQQRIPINSPGHALNPNACGADSGDGACTFDLTMTSGERVDESHPIAVTAHRLRQLITSDRDDQIVSDEINDYRAVAVGLLNACDEPELRARAHLTDTAISGLWRKSERAGAAPPAETLFTATVLTGADRILHSADSRERQALIAPLLMDSAARAADRTPFAQLRAYWPYSQRFERLALQVLDRNLGTVDRLRYRSPTQGATQPDRFSQGDSNRIAGQTPQLFWPQLAYLLAANADGDADTYRAALSTAYVLIGRTDRSVAAVHTLLGWPEGHAPQFRGALLGEATPREATIRWLCELRGDSPFHAAPFLVDYRRRRAVDMRPKLTDALWLSLCRALDWPPSTPLRRRCVAWFIGRRITGLARPTVDVPPTAAQYTAFLLGLRVDHAIVLNSFAQYIVNAMKVPGPALAQPPLRPRHLATMLEESRWNNDRLRLDALLQQQPSNTLSHLEGALGISSVRLRLLLEHRTDAVDEQLVANRSFLRPRPARG
ncbi:TniQ family protein [Curtobacterium sp. NPDC089689]|uniref:TniQ family protein n=1 Tax=Curtobacterium sp. NPDC089689 TaxID=3363968 RepID=UPI0037F69FDE